MTTPASTSKIPQSPAEFATAALAVIVKCLREDAADPETEAANIAKAQAELDALVTSYAHREPALIMKAVPSRKMIYGWASVVTKDGESVEDLQGDVLEIDNLRTTVHKFMGDRAGDAMHDRNQVGEIVDSFVMDDEVAAAFGVSFGREGWMVGYRVDDANVWKRVQSGELKAFSIDALGERTPITGT